MNNPQQTTEQRDPNVSWKTPPEAQMQTAINKLTKLNATIVMIRNRLTAMG